MIDSHRRGLVMLRRALRRFQHHVAMRGHANRAHVKRLFGDIEEAFEYLDDVSVGIKHDTSFNAIFISFYVVVDGICIGIGYDLERDCRVLMFLYGTQAIGFGFAGRVAEWMNYSGPDNCTFGRITMF